MAKTLHTYILIDRSGSMARRWEETIEAINGYVSEMKSSKTRASVTVSAFDRNGYGSKSGKSNSDMVTLAESVPLSKWKKLKPNDVRPRGMTPLNDAILDIIETANYQDHKRTSLIIMTDGIENASKRSSREARAQLNKCKEKNWDIVMLGADFDAMKIRDNYGMTYDQTINIRGEENLDATYKNLAMKTSSYAATGESRAFTQQERDEAIGVYIAPTTDPKLKDISKRAAS